MRVERGVADAEQERAYQHAAVQAIAEKILVHARDQRVYAIARQAVISIIPATREELRATLGGTTDETLLDDVEDIAQHGATIANHPHDETRERRKGALLERVVMGLLEASRTGVVTRESRIHLTVNTHSGDRVSGRKDAVVDAPVFEVYECKWGVGIAQWEIYQLADIYLTGLADKPTTTRPYTCIATMASERAIKARVSRLDLPEILYVATGNQLADLPLRPASNRLR